MLSRLTNTVKQTFWSLCSWDVNGGPQFTYISLDDFRVVYSYLAGDGSYTSKTVSMYQTPCSSHLHFRNGLTESQAADLKLPYAVKEIPVAAMPSRSRKWRPSWSLQSCCQHWNKEILGGNIFSEGSPRNHQHHTVLWITESHTLTSDKTNLHSNLGWKLEWLVCDLSWDYIVSNSPYLSCFFSQLYSSKSIKLCQLHPCHSQYGLRLAFQFALWFSFEYQICLFSFFWYNRNMKLKAIGPPLTGRSSHFILNRLALGSTLPGSLPSIW